jgi:hypothetical protein
MVAVVVVVVVDIDDDDTVKASVGMVATDNIRTTTSTRNCSDDTMSPFS